MDAMIAVESFSEGVNTLYEIANISDFSHSDNLSKLRSAICLLKSGVEVQVDDEMIEHLDELIEKLPVDGGTPDDAAAMRAMAQSCLADIERWRVTLP